MPFGIDINAAVDRAIAGAGPLLDKAMAQLQPMLTQALAQAHAEAAALQGSITALTAAEAHELTEAQKTNALLRAILAELRKRPARPAG
jgi:hypothetical protein